MIERVYDDRTDETLFTGSEVECYAWINANYPENHEDYDHIWIGQFYSKPSEEDLNLVNEMIDAHGLAYAIDTGTLSYKDVEHERLSELIYEVKESLRLINKIVDQ